MAQENQKPSLQYLRSRYNKFYKDEDWRVFSQQEIQQVAAIDENGITHSNVIKKIR